MAKTGNSYGHPHQEAIDNLNSVGATIYGTDVCGNIVVSTNGSDYTVELEVPVPTVEPDPPLLLQ